MLQYLRFAAIVCIVQFLAADMLSAQTPVTITAETSPPVQPGDVHTWFSMDISTPPSGGANMAWDYSGPVTSEWFYKREYEVPNNPEFPNATTSREALFELNAIQIDGRAYTERLASGDAIVGYKYNGSFVDLGLGYLDIPEQNVYEVGVPDLHLPASFQSSYSDTTRRPITTLLTVPALQLDEAMLVYTEIRYYSDSVIGWGTLKMPEDYGTYQVLLQKRTYTSIDSFLLEGQPAPPQLLDIFGVTQGRVSVTEEWTFHAPGVASNLMVFTQGAAGFETYYREASSVSHINENVAATLPVNVFPNPVTGERLGVAFEKASSSQWQLAISNGLGETVQWFSLDQPAGPVRLELGLSAGLPSGGYYYQIFDEAGHQQARGKFVIGE